MGNYYLDNINLRTTYGIEVQKTTGLFDIPKRKDPVAYSWPDENGEQAFLDTDDIVFEPRDIVLQCFIKADSEAAFHNKYNKFWGDFMTASTETNKLHYLRHPYSPYIYECYIKDGTVFNRMTKFNSNKAVGTFYITLREPVPILPCDQKVITLNGTNQSASIASSMTPLQMNTEDFIITGWFRTSANYTADSGWIACKTGTGMWGIYIAQTTNKLTMYLSDGTNVASAVSTLTYNDGNIHFFAMVADKGSATGLMMFIDNAYIGAASLAAVGDLADNTAFSVGKRGANNDGYFNGSIDEVRVFRFGTGGLYVSGTFGSSGIIRVGSSTGELIWADSASLKDTCLLTRLYKWPFATLHQLGVDLIKETAQSEIIVNGTDWTDTDSNGLADNWLNFSSTPADGTLTIITGAGFTGNAQQITKNKVSGSSIELRQIIPALTIGAVYELSFKYTKNSVGKLLQIQYDTYALRLNISTDVATATLHTTVFVATTAAANLVFFIDGIPASGDYFAIDDVTLKLCTAKARYKFDDTVTDSGAFALDLTANNAPTYSVR